MILLPRSHDRESNELHRLQDGHIRATPGATQRKALALTLGEGSTLSDMLNYDEVRDLMDCPNMTDAEIAELLADLHSFLCRVLDECFRKTLESDDF